MKKIISRRVAAAAGAAGVAVMGLTSLGAGGAAAGPLPGGYLSKTLVDGTPVSVRLFDESVNVQRPLIAFPTTREAWVTGKVKVTVGGEAEGGSIKAGYIVGCQVNVGIGADLGGGIGLDAAPSGNGGIDAAPRWGGNYGNPGGGSSLDLGPGDVTYLPVITEEDSDDDAVESFSFSGNTGGVAYSQEALPRVDCGGFAEAKAKITVTVNTDAVKGVVTLYGQPFSLG